jgi:ABC-type polysaccharide/polyol phosphate transport system ATPase subunit
MKEIAIELNNVCVSYLHNRRGIYSIKDFVLKGGLFSPFEYKSVLHNINLNVYKGESIGILGRNGEGKSTLLRTIAGIITPTSGTCKVHIEISPLLALGAGLELELTGIENIKIYIMPLVEILIKKQSPQLLITLQIFLNYRWNNCKCQQKCIPLVC